LVQIGEELVQETNKFIAAHQAIAAEVRRPYAN
jgi:hypothetical protein